MILTNYDNEIEVSEQLDESLDFSIDQESLGVLFKGFSDTLYSNKIGSIVREIASNCFDSHQEAGVTIPVTIQIIEPEYDGTGSRIIFSDYGMGLSPDRIKNIYSKYFSSSKRGDNNQIGGFGIGAKSPLSYTETFFVETVFNKILYKYIIHRGTAIPKIELVHKEESDKRNGTSVIIPFIKSSDATTFRKELKSQLKFFDNIDYINCGIDNSYRIFQGEHFIVRVDESMKNAPSRDYNISSSICLGKVQYPINFSVCNLSESYFKTHIALKMEIGDLPVTMNREMIEYTEKSIEKIRKKIELAKEEIKEILKENNTTVNFKEYLTLRKNPAVLRLEDYYVYTDTFGEGNPISFTGLDSRIKIPNNPFFEFSVDKQIEKGKLKNAYRSVEDKLYSPRTSIYRLKGKLSKRKTLYIEETASSPIYLLTYAPIEATKVENYLGVTYEKDCKELAASYQSFIFNEVLSNSKSYDKVEVPEIWIKNYEDNLKNNRVTYINENITIRKASYYDGNINFSLMDMTVPKAIEWVNKYGMVVYGFMGEEEKLTYAAQILKSFKEDIRGSVIKLAKGNLKYFEGCKNLIHIDHFHATYIKMIAKVSLAKQMLSTRTELERVMMIFNSINHPFAENLKIMELFIKTFDLSYNSGIMDLVITDPEVQNVPVVFDHDKKKIYDMRAIFAEWLDFLDTYPLLLAIDARDIPGGATKSIFKYMYSERKTIKNYYKR